MDALGAVYGHVRVATSELLATDSAETARLELGLQALDLQAILEELEVEPVYVPPGLSAAESLAAAADLLDRHRAGVPLGVWSRLQALVTQVG